MTIVLLAEDQLELRGIYEAYLTARGLEVLVASDGEEALATARAELPEVIVLDHSLPRRTGIDVARELAADPATANIPIILLTAHSYGAVGRKARAAGCVGFLAKPCQPSRVLEEVLRHAGRSAAG